MHDQRTNKPRVEDTTLGWNLQRLQRSEFLCKAWRLKDDNFLDRLGEFKGGLEARDAINVYLEKYGMRGVGEIDLTRIRWREKPITLVPIILSNIKNFAPGVSKRKFEQGRQEA